MSEITKIKAIKLRRYIYADITVLEDRMISWKAKAILLYMLSRPDDWEIRTSDLINRAPDGESALRSGIQDLIQFGYIYQAIKRDRNSIIDWKYYVFEIPCTVYEAEKIIIEDGWEMSPHIRSQMKDLENGQSYLWETKKYKTYLYEIATLNNKHLTINQENTNNQKDSTSSFEKDLNEDVDRGEPSSNSLSKQQQKTRRITPTKESLSQLKDIIREGNENSLMPSVLAIIDYWNGLGLARLNYGTKAALSVNSLIRSLRLGTFFDHIDGFQDYRGRKFTDKEIYKSIGNFALAATNYDYSPVNKQFYVRSGMVDFFYNGFRTGDNKSWFIKFLENPPTLLSRKVIKLIDDPNESITGVFRQAYLNKVCGGVEVELTDHQINDLRVACKKALEFYQKNSRKFVDWARRGEMKFALDVVEALEANIENQHNGDWSKVTTGWFSSDILWNKTLPAWLNKEGLIEQ